MAKVHILNVTVHNNPAPFFTPFQFEIHFECLEELQDGKTLFSSKLLPTIVNLNKTGKFFLIPRS